MVGGQWSATPRVLARFKGRLTKRDLDRFPDDTLFDRLARTVCEAGCLPRKELYEAWEMARRVRRLFRGGRVLDLGGGHGLLAQVMLLLDDSSPNALVIDKTLPRVEREAARRARCRRGRGCRDASRLSPARSTTSTFSTPTSSCRVTRAARSPIGFSIAPQPRVRASRSCRAATISIQAMTADCPGGSTAPLAIDIVRAMRLAQQGYRIWTQAIPAGITPKNRLLLGAPTSGRR